MTSCNPVNETATRSTAAERPLSNEQVSASLLADLLEQAHRHEAALVLACRAGDESVGATVARRLSRTLLRAVELVRTGAAAAPDQASRFSEATHEMCDVLRRATVALAGRGLVAEAVWGVASGRMLEMRGGRSHIFDLEASGRDLQEAVVRGLHVSHSRFITDMRRARFADSLIEASDFTYANLQGTLWQRTRVRNCYLREVSFVDAAFDDTMFIDCDMRGADFTMESIDLSTTPGVTFIRCDLRDARWSGRDHSGFELIDCQVHDSPDRSGPVAEPAEQGQGAMGADGGAQSLSPTNEDGGVAAHIVSRVASAEGSTW